MAAVPRAINMSRFSMIPECNWYRRGSERRASEFSQRGSSPLQTPALVLGTASSFRIRCSSLPAFEGLRDLVPVHSSAGTLAENRPFEPNRLKCQRGLQCRSPLCLDVSYLERSPRSIACSQPVIRISHVIPNWMRIFGLEYFFAAPTLRFYPRSGI